MNDNVHQVDAVKHDANKYVRPRSVTGGPPIKTNKWGTRSAEVRGAGGEGLEEGGHSLAAPGEIRVRPTDCTGYI